MRIIVPGFAAVSGAFLVISWLNDNYDANLRDPLVFNGWLLFSGMAFQVLMRFKSVHPDSIRGSTSLWNRLHIGVGFLVLLVFGLHTSWTMPDTLLEWALWVLFATVVVSGGIGAWLNRAIPFRLEQHHERLPLSALPERQADLARQAEHLALASVERSGSLAVSNLFADQLHGFFGGPKNLFAHLRGSHRPLKQILFRLQNTEHDIAPSAQSVLDEMRVLVEGKDRLDFQHAHEAALRAWLFVHLPATYALVTVTIAHVAIVYAFTSGAR